MCENKHQLDTWIRENFSKDMDQIISITEVDVCEKAEIWFAHQVDETKIRKLFNVGINPFDEIQNEDFKVDSYESIRKYYIDLLIKSIRNYINEAIKRKGVYEHAYEKYKCEFDRQQKKVEKLKKELENKGFFSFSKKLSDKLSSLEASSSASSAVCGSIANNLSSSTRISPP